ncbi:permease [Marinobacterium nitratireducens]|uniref:Permease n=1 Tax=Marinobacterium nitratireducens TaxID=518897 RepID=A0A917ZR14_9GAMM|nr:FtsX-like permease family protein [Marinobacterium nitratireducens]GGO87831.1 permease [Marinobacterium nitratireducens]
MNSIVLNLARRQARRSLRSPEWRALLAALLVAITLISLLTQLGDRLEQSLNRRTAELLGADLVLRSEEPVNIAADTGVRSSRVAQFPTMIEAGDEMLLTSVRAVDAPYPLRGEIITEPAQHPAIPEPGTAWAEPRVFEMLQVEPGDSIQLGYSELRLTHRLISSPDRGSGFRAFSPGLIMRANELDATGVIAPGSRVQYRQLFAGPAAAIAALEQTLSANLRSDQRLYSLNSDQPMTGRALRNAELYLRLSALFALLLGALTITLSLRRYNAAQHARAALLLSLGLDSRKLLGLYAYQLLFGWVACALTGTLLAVALQQLLVGLVGDLLPQPVPQAGFASIASGALIGLLLLATLGLPAFYRLSRVSVAALFRETRLPSGSRIRLTYLVGLLLLAALMSLYVDSVAMAVMLLGTLTLSGLMVGLAVQWLLQRLATALRERLRLGRLLALRVRQQRRWHRLQGATMTLLLTLMATLLIARGDLLQQWRSQFPPDTPNYFLINIQPWERERLDSFLAGQELTPTLYPMVRGRITSRNGTPLAELSLSEEQRRHNALRRELNLTWSGSLPDNNALPEGDWWPPDTSDAALISVEQDLATALGVGLGDRVGFQIGAQEIEARVSSIRTVEWESFQPNFYVIFSPGALDRMPATYITAMRLDGDQRGLARVLLKEFPTLTLIDIDQLLNQAQSLIERLIDSSSLILLLTLLAGLLLLLVTLMQELERRRYESALLQTLGASPRQSRQLDLLELLCLGLICGLLAALCSEAVLALIHTRMLQAPVTLHPLSWLLLPPLSALLFLALGALVRRPLDQARCFGLLKAG